MSILAADVRPINDAKSINKGIRYVMANVVFTALYSFILGFFVARQHYPYLTVLWGVLAIAWGFRTHRSIKRLASGDPDL